MEHNAPEQVTSAQRSRWWLLISVPAKATHHAAYALLQLIGAVATRILGLMLALSIFAFVVVWLGLDGHTAQNKAMIITGSIAGAAFFLQIVVAIVVGLFAPRSLQHKH